MAKSTVYKLSARVKKWGYKYSTLGVYEKFLKDYGLSKHIAEDEWKIDVTCEYLNSRSGNKIELESGILREYCLELLK